ncbi:MAG: hypothetical protein EOP83_04790 [Verrucomicrobiaceae bacterium]|nr:MAG: hypothetical protein EOP83_04790 [Verrucomicrobiaceae bacterium]
MGEGDQAFAVMLPFEPYGETLCIAPDNSPDSKSLIQELLPHWPVLWPKIQDKLERGIADYEADTVFDGADFIAQVDRLDQDVFMADKASIFLRLEFDDPPLWDCFIEGDELVHFQPVF